MPWIEVSKEEAQAFIKDVNRQLDEQGFEGRYYWDDGAPEDEDGNFIGEGDRYLTDWVGYLMWRGDTPTVRTLPAVLLINGISVQPLLEDGWETAHYQSATLYKAWKADKFKLNMVLDAGQLRFLQGICEQMQIPYNAEPVG